jgi:hypothetical protein
MPSNDMDLTGGNSEGSKEIRGAIVTECSLTEIGSADALAGKNVEPSTDPQLTVAASSSGLVKSESESFNSNEKAVNHSRKGETVRSAKSLRKRRIIDDEDDESDDHQNDASILVKSESSSCTVEIVDLHDDANNQSSFDTASLTSRPSRSRTTALKGRPSIHDDDEDTMPVRSSRRPPPSSGQSRLKVQDPARPKIEPVLPSEPRRDAIPKKIPKIESAKAETNTKKSSLLDQLAQPPSTTSAPVRSPRRDHVAGGPTARDTGSKPDVKPSIKIEPNMLHAGKAHVKTESNVSYKGETTPVAEMSAPEVIMVVTKEQKLQNFLATQRAKLARGKSGTESTVVADLVDLCNRCSQSPDFRLNRPIYSSQKIDLSGSFLKAEDRYDFFDTNERGEITLTPPIPMFPEDFPAGTKEHGLSWWGIVDPEKGARKFAPLAGRQGDGNIHQAAAQQPSHAQSSMGRRESEDRRARNGSAQQYHGRPSGGHPSHGPSGVSRSPAPIRRDDRSWGGGRGGDVRSNHPSENNRGPSFTRDASSRSNSRR